MSKEQTLITAEIRKILYDTESIEDAVEPIKELINAKVLEELEGFAKHLEKTGVFVMLDVEEYYETEVKPKYK